MKLYLLTRKNAVGYDETIGLVVRAKSSRAARELAAFSRGDEGTITWKDPRLSTCKELKLEGDEEVVLRDFRAG